MEQCRTDLEEKSSANLILAQQLRNANCEIRKLQVTNQQMSNEMDKLVDKIEESNTENGSDLPVANLVASSSISTSSVRGYDLNSKRSIGVYVQSDDRTESISEVVEVDGNKENFSSEVQTKNTKPTVTFSEDIVEPKARSFGGRRGGRVLNCTPTIIYSME